MTPVRGRAFAAAALIALAIPPAARQAGHPITARLTETKAQLLKISDGQSTANLDFGSAPPGAGRRSAGQVLKLTYPVDNITRDIRVYTNNRGWTGDRTDSGGLILSSATLSKRLPLFRLSFSSAQPAGSVAFTEENASSWNQIFDINDTNFEQKRSASIVPQDPLGSTFIYFGARLESPAQGSYSTRIIVEIVNNVTDDGAPGLAHEVLKNVNFRRKAMPFTAVIAEDVQVTTATFHYRFEGEESYAVLPVELVQNPSNPFQWTAKVTIPKEKLRIGVLEYYFEAADGFVQGFSGTDSGPNRTAILDEFAPVVETIPPQSGGKISIVEDTGAGATSLDFPPGSIEIQVVITAKKIDPLTQPMLSTHRPVSVYEFTPERSVSFLSPAKLTLSYVDDNGDGFVDATGEAARDLKVYRLDEGEWRFLGGKVDEAMRTVTVNITHLSTFGLFPAQAGAGDLRPKEKIITPGLKDGINDSAVFDGLQERTEPFRVEIFDVMGRRVRTLDQVGQWDGTDASGRTVETGVYLYQVHIQGRVLSGTITVAK